MAAAPGLVATGEFKRATKRAVRSVGRNAISGTRKAGSWMVGSTGKAFVNTKAGRALQEQKNKIVKNRQPSKETKNRSANVKSNKRMVNNKSGIEYGEVYKSRDLFAVRCHSDFSIFFDQPPPGSSTDK
ncbi:MAG: hypothetical protein OXB84_08860, partial [Halobacteriovoraceae bacterium]|nr:hypothetical protein [Halobacteriovoraceae bacterium]